MITTKRYDYILFSSIQQHPLIANHRGLNQDKVAHYSSDILKNGLLEPLVIWERNPGEFYLVGGFHRLAAIRRIRENNPGYFDRVDVRVVAGDVDEMRALNLKLNADRLDARLTDYFDSVIYLNNANWSREKIAEFLDQREELIDEILRYVPGMDPRLRILLENDRVSWNRAKTICRDVLAAPAGREKDVLEQALAGLAAGPVARPRRVLTVRSAIRRLSERAEKQPKTEYTVSAADLLALLVVVQGRQADETHLARVRRKFPGLLKE